MTRPSRCPHTFRIPLRVPQPCWLPAGHPGAHAALGDWCFGGSQRAWQAEQDRDAQAEQAGQAGVIRR